MRKKILNVDDPSSLVESDLHPWGLTPPIYQNSTSDSSPYARTWSSHLRCTPSVDKSNIGKRH